MRTNVSLSLDVSAHDIACCSNCLQKGRKIMFELIMHQHVQWRTYYSWKVLWLVSESYLSYNLFKFYDPSVQLGCKTEIYDWFLFATHDPPPHTRTGNLENFKENYFSYTKVLYIYLVRLHMRIVQNCVKCKIHVQCLRYEVLLHKQWSQSFQLLLILCVFLMNANIYLQC